MGEGEGKAHPPCSETYKKGREAGPSFPSNSRRGRERKRTVPLLLEGKGKEALPLSKGKEGRKKGTLVMLTRKGVREHGGSFVFFDFTKNGRGRGKKGKNLSAKGGRGGRGA